MERSKQVHKGRLELAARAYERWKSYQPADETPRRSGANRSNAAVRSSFSSLNTEERSRFKEREQLRHRFESTAYRQLRRAAERQIGATLDFVDLPPNEQALKAGRPVVRLVSLGAPGMVPEGFATGFLIAPELLLTNHHVFRTADEAEGVGAQFLYERTHNGLREGLIFELQPKRFFLNHKGLDYAVVAVKPTALDGAPLSQFRFLPLIPVKGKTLKGDPINIIQHPEGRPKQYATVNNQLLELRDDGFLLYETDTLEGSSGAPLFNQHWEVIGLHHCGVPKIENGQLLTRDGRRLPLDTEVADCDLIWVANEGTRVSDIIASLQDQQLDDADQQRILKSLLETMADPLRIVAEQSPLVAGSMSVDAVSSVESGAAMAQNIFQFSGPVTLNVLAPPIPPVRPGKVTVTPEAGAAVSVIAPFREKTLKFDENYRSRSTRGYNADFLSGWTVPVPVVTAQHAGDVLHDDRGEPWVIPYYHFSLTMNRDRRLLAWAAGNVSYRAEDRRFTRSRKEYGGENWRLDPRVALEAPGVQIEDADFYVPARKIDRGHIVRREDNAWGATAKEAEFANSDTYHWTNCTPQSEAFNQSRLSGVWGQFEEHIQNEVEAVGNRMSVFAGPVLSANDPEHGYEDGSTIQVPMEFWKVVLCVSKENGELRRLAYGFVFDQTEPVQRLGFERLNMDDFEIQQVPIAEISRKTGIRFDASVLAADVLDTSGAEESMSRQRTKRIHSLESVVLR